MKSPLKRTSNTDDYRSPCKPIWPPARRPSRLGQRVISACSFWGRASKPAMPTFFASDGKAPGRARLGANQMDSARPGKQGDSAICASGRQSRGAAEGTLVTALACSDSPRLSPHAVDHPGLVNKSPRQMNACSRGGWRRQCPLDGIADFSRLLPARYERCIYSVGILDSNWAGC